MKLKDLCAEIGLPQILTERVLHFAANNGLNGYRSEIEGMKSAKTAEQAEKTLECKCADKTEVLACMLECAAESADSYREKGIPLAVFWDTMKCFTRFCNEHFKIAGEYAFDRAWWTWRQLSLRLFRLGELEYEFTQTPEISIHIPSDARLIPDLCDESIARARQFVAAYFPAYQNARMVCESWLLSPSLEQMLGANSNIIQFQKRFVIEKLDRNDEAFRYFVFGRGDGDYKNYPEKTSLQTNMKKFLLNGGKVGSAQGYLKDR